MKKILNQKENMEKRKTNARKILSKKVVKKGYILKILS